MMLIKKYKVELSFNEIDVLGLALRGKLEIIMKFIYIFYFLMVRILEF